jgi:hypothetical protein
VDWADDVSPGNPLGKDFTLSPFIRNDNFHLSLSVEPTCKRLPYLDPNQRAKPKHAYLLAKDTKYLVDEPKFSWTIPGLAKIQHRLGIKVLAGMKVDRPEVEESFEQHGLTNVGQLNKTEFYRQLAISSVLVGVGRPRISPSPWDALCMGVPVSHFISVLETCSRDSSSILYSNGTRKTPRVGRHGLPNNGT